MGRRRATYRLALRQPKEAGVAQAQPHVVNAPRAPRAALDSAPKLLYALGMALWLTALLVLAQQPPDVAPATGPTATPTATPAAAPTVPPLLPAAEPPPEAPTPPRASTTPSAASRLLLSGAAATAAGALGLGVTLFTSAGNPGLDLTFGNAALGALVVAGVGFWIHSLLGGRGEVMLGLLGSAAIYALGAVVGSFAESSQVGRAVWTTAIAALPAAVLTVALLEVSAGRQRPKPTVAPMAVPGGAGAQLVLPW